MTAGSASARPAPRPPPCSCWLCSPECAASGCRAPACELPLRRRGCSREGNRNRSGSFPPGPPARRPAGLQAARPVSPSSVGSRACAARPVSRAQHGQVLLLRGGDAVPPPAGDQRHAAGGPGLPEGRGPGDREGRGLRVCAPGGAGRGPFQPTLPLLRLVQGRAAPLQTLLSSLSSPGWEVKS